jgi:hypothetical protein
MSTDARTATLSDADWARFEREGYLLLGRTLGSLDLAALQERIDDIMLGRVRDERLMMQVDQGGEYAAMAPQTIGFKGARLDYRKIEGLERDDLFLGYLQKPLFRDIAARAYGDVSVSVFRSMFMNKPARKGTLLPWHQDGGTGWGLDRHPLVTVWTALDPATVANGCVQIIPGSHSLGLLSERGHTITPEQELEHCRPGRVVFLELAPGESALLHNWTLHRSDVNATDLPRRAFSVCYMDGRTRNQDGHQFPVVFGDHALRPQALAHVPR